MGIDNTTEKRFEEDIESSFISLNGGYTKGRDTYNAALGLYVNTLIGFVKSTTPLTRRKNSAWLLITPATAMVFCLCCDMVSSTGA